MLIQWPGWEEEPGCWVLGAGGWKEVWTTHKRTWAAKRKGSGEEAGEKVIYGKLGHFYSVNGKECEGRAHDAWEMGAESRQKCPRLLCRHIVSVPIPALPPTSCRVLGK